MTRHAPQYGRILRQLREAKGRSQVDVARSVGISPAQLARLETNQRGLYVEDFIRIAAALGEKPGNLLPNDLGDFAHMKPIIDRIAAVKPEYLALVSTIINKIVTLAEHVSGSSESHDRIDVRRRTRLPSRRREAIR